MNYEISLLNNKENIKIDKVVDTKALAHKLFPGDSNSLNDLCRKLDVDLKDREKYHGALVDA